MDKSFSIDVSRLKRGGEEFEGAIDDSVYGFADDYLTPFAGLRYSLFAQQLGGELLVRGELEQDFSAVCSRCGADFDFTVKIPDFITSVEVDEKNEIMDLTNELRDSIILSLPTYPVCREDCRGICRICGRNLNEGPCSCQSEERDERWNALNDLMK